MLLKYIFAMSSNLVVLIVIKCPFDTLSQLLVNYILSIYTVKLPKSRFAGSNGYSPFSEEVRLYIICAIKYDSLYGYWIKHIVPFFTIPCVEWKGTS